MQSRHTDSPLVVCCHCCRIEDDGWVPLDPRGVPEVRAVAHVICPACVTAHYAPPENHGRDTAA